MKFIRSFPEICASTLCPFSSSMANIVLGNGSTTVPSTSIASRFATGGAGSLSHTECRPGRADTERVAYQKSHSPRNDWPAATAPSALPRHVSCAPNARPVGQLRRRWPAFRASASPSLDGREDLGAVLGDGDGVLEMGRECAVGRIHRPAVLLHVHVAAAEREHRLDGEAHAGLQLRAAGPGPVVRDLWLLVHV